MLKVHGVKLLLIDDSLDFQLLIKRFLEGSGLTCSMAADTVQATTIALREQPDIILLDIGLPGGGGLLLLDRLRTNLHTREIPIVVVTAQTTTGLEAQVRAKGATGFLQKPFDKKILLDLMQQVLDLGRTTHPVSSV